MALIDKLTAIADAIRGKTGGTDALTLDQMAMEIAGISGGTGDALLDSLLDRSITEYNDHDLTYIGDAAFNSCTKLVKIEVPNVTCISSYAFEKCYSLTSISLPSVTELNQQVFRDCTSLESVYLPVFTGENGGISNRNPNYLFQGCTSLKSVTLPEVFRAGSFGMFRDCTNLEEVRMPKLLGRVGQYHLNNCTRLRLFDAGKIENLTDYAWGSNTKSLETLILRSETVVSFSQQSGSTLHTSYTGEVVCDVYVPEALIANYKLATNWSAVYEAGRCNFVALEGSEYE